MAVSDFYFWNFGESLSELFRVHAVGPWPPGQGLARRPGADRVHMDKSTKALTKPPQNSINRKRSLLCGIGRKSLPESFLFDSQTGPAEGRISSSPMRVAVFKRTVHLVRGPGAKPLLARALFSVLGGFCLLFRVLWRPSWRVCLCLVAFVPRLQDRGSMNSLAFSRPGRVDF